MRLKLLLLLLAAWLRFHGLAQDARFHPDEAFFATFARKAAVNGDWLLRGPLDKTPLSIYAQAISMMLVGVTPLPDGVLTLDAHAGEFAARVPGVFASLLLVAVVAGLAKRLYPNVKRQAPSPYMERREGGGVALPVMLLTAVSPFAIAFSATAFTDGLMLLCLALSLWAAGRGRWVWAGVWLALGFACKQQAVFYLPLVALVGSSLGEGQKPTPKKITFALLRLTLPLLFTLALLALWDSARAQPTPLWELAAANNDPERVLARADEILPRLRLWISYLAYVAGPPWLTALLATLAVGALVRRVTRASCDHAVRLDLTLLVYSLAYFLLHWLLAFNTYDRYFLLLLPPLLLLLARGITDLTRGHEGAKTQRPRIINRFASLLLCIFALSFYASGQAIPVGGDRGAHQGVDAMAAYLDAKPLGTIIYDHWLGWELGYYLGSWTNKRLTYYPSPDALAADAQAQADPAPRYLPAPRDADAQPWLDALREAGFKLSLAYQTPKFVTYELVR